MYIHAINCSLAGFFFDVSDEPILLCWVTLIAQLVFEVVLKYRSVSQRGSIIINLLKYPF